MEEKEHDSVGCTLLKWKAKWSTLTHKYLNHTPVPALTNTTRLDVNKAKNK